MQHYINEDMLTQLGIDLNGKDVASLLDHLNETLEQRVGAEITDALDDDQRQTLRKLQETAR